MTGLIDSPPAIFGFSLITLWLSARIGAFCRFKLRPLPEQDDFTLVIGAALTLLGLLIGFTFSMATSRYDQRKNYEEEEANAIGTEYLRVDLIPAVNAASLRDMLKRYLELRISFYRAHEKPEEARIDTDTTHLQLQLWSQVQAAANAEPTPTVALAVSGMNDVLNAQGYTQAAWWNRIPGAAWVLMATIAICCNFLIGYSSHRTGTGIFLVIPFAVAVSFLLIADIDSPRGGLIRVRPQNLVSLSSSLGR